VTFFILIADYNYWKIASLGDGVFLFRNNVLYERVFRSEFNIPLILKLLGIKNNQMPIEWHFLLLIFTLVPGVKVVYIFNEMRPLKFEYSAALTETVFP
jgi:hypothetical protein